MFGELKELKPTQNNTPRRPPVEKAINFTASRSLSLKRKSFLLSKMVYVVELVNRTPHKIKYRNQGTLHNFELEPDTNTIEGGSDWVPISNYTRDELAKGDKGIDLEIESKAEFLICLADGGNKFQVITPVDGEPYEKSMKTLSVPGHASEIIFEVDVQDNEFILRIREYHSALVSQSGRIQASLLLEMAKVIGEVLLGVFL